MTQSMVRTIEPPKGACNRNNGFLLPRVQNPTPDTRDDRKSILSINTVLHCKTYVKFTSVIILKIPALYLN